MCELGVEADEDVVVVQVGERLGVRGGSGQVGHVV